MSKSTTKKGETKAIKDPFTVRSGKNDSKKGGLQSVETPATVRGSVDSYCELNAQIKTLEGELSTHKAEIEQYARSVHAHRMIEGKRENFKIMGNNDNRVSWVVSAASSNFNQEDVDQFAMTWTKKAAESLLVKDIGSVRFDAKAFEKHRDAVMAVLNTLDPDIFAEVFTPAVYKVKETVLEDMRQFAKSDDQMEALTRDLKIKTSIRQG